MRRDLDVVLGKCAGVICYSLTSIVTDELTRTGWNSRVRYSGRKKSGATISIKGHSKAA